MEQQAKLMKPKSKGLWHEFVATMREDLPTFWLMFRPLNLEEGYNKMEEVLEGQEEELEQPVREEQGLFEMPTFDFGSLIEGL